MALILSYRLEVPDGVNKEAFEGLKAQIGNTAIMVGIPLNPDDPEAATLTLRGLFISVEGEHAEEAHGG